MLPEHLEPLAETAIPQEVFGGVEGRDGRQEGKLQDRAAAWAFVVLEGRFSTKKGGSGLPVLTWPYFVFPCALGGKAVIEAHGSILTEKWTTSSTEVNC